MPSLVIQNSNGKSINSVDEWSRPKKGNKHWKDGRSAKELAKAWFRKGTAEVPQEIEALLNSHPSIRGFVPELAIPEFVMHLDNFKGEGRNHDLVLVGQVILVAIEAKADESFGEIISSYLAQVKSKPSSKVPDRINILSQSLWGRPIDQDLGRLRYQLMTGLAGTLTEAKEQLAVKAVFVIHEFISEKVTEKVLQNSKDFEIFVQSFPGMKHVSIRSGHLIDGISIAGGLFVPGDIPVLLGKVATILTDAL